MPGLRRVGSLVLTVIVLGVGTGSAHAATPARGLGCATPRGWRVVLRDARAAVIKRDVNRTDAAGTYTGWKWRYCLRPSRRFRGLFSDVSMDGGLGDIITHSSLVLSGTHLADMDTDEGGGGRYGCLGSITVYDLRTGKGKRVYDWDCGGPAGYNPAPKITGLTVNQRGFAAWHVTSYPIPTSTDMTGISCPSVSLCVAVDWAGNVLTSSDPAGGRAAWAASAIQSPPPALEGVSCPSVSFCAAIGDGGVFTSSGPAGGPTAWRAAPLRRSLNAISCPSSSLCVAVDGGDVVVSTDPSGGSAAWTVTQVEPGTYLTDVSCPSASLCVATDASGNVVASTNPTGGASAWRVAHVDPEPFSPSLNAISCPSTSLCVASAFDYSGGNLAVSTNPAGGAGAWAFEHVDDRKEPTTVECASSSFCVAFGSPSDEIASTDPAGGADSWKVTPLGHVSPTAASCPTTSLCVAVSGGNVLTSTQPAVGGSWQSAPVDVPDCALTTPCAAEQIDAYDGRLMRVLDNVAPGTGTVLSRPGFVGDSVTWLHEGTKHRVKLA